MDFNFNTINSCEGVCDSCKNSCGKIKDRLEEFQMLVAMNVCTGNCDKCGIPCVNNKNPKLQLDNKNEESAQIASNKLETFKEHDDEFNMTSISEFLEEDENNSSNLILKEDRTTIPPITFNIKEMDEPECSSKEDSVREDNSIDSNIIETRHSIKYDNAIQNNMYYKHNTKNGISELKYDEGKHPDDSIHKFVKKILAAVDSEMYNGIY